jgi:hypothetical protein
VGGTEGKESVDYEGGVERLDAVGVRVGRGGGAEGGVEGAAVGAALEGKLD